MEGKSNLRIAVEWIIIIIGLLAAAFAQKLASEI